MLTFEDIYIGLDFPPLMTVLDHETIRQYAEAVEDFNPLFVDADYAATSQYGGLVNHPTTAAIFSFKAYRTGPTMPPGIIHAKQRYKFFSPTRPDEILITRAKVVDKYIKREKKYVVIESLTVNEQNQPKVQSISVSIWPI